jgi:hypothetical protein
MDVDGLVQFVDLVATLQIQESVKVGMDVSSQVEIALMILVA